MKLRIAACVAGGMLQLKGMFCSSAIVPHSLTQYRLDYLVDKDTFHPSIKSFLPLLLL